MFYFDLFKSIQYCLYCWICLKGRVCRILCIFSIEFTKQGRGVRADKGGELMSLSPYRSPPQKNRAYFSVYRYISTKSPPPPLYFSSFAPKGGGDDSQNSKTGRQKCWKEKSTKKSIWNIQDNASRIFQVDKIRP